MRNLLKKYSVTILTSFLFLLMVSTPANAHVLKTDGSVGAVLHVSPDDDPIARVPTDFFFELKDKNNKFTPGNCDCVVEIVQEGKVIIYQPLFANNPSPSLDDASLTYELPQKGIYTIRLVGSPKEENVFERFELSWDIRVEREAPTSAAQESSSSNDQNIKYIVLVGAVVIFVGLILSKKKKTTK